MIKRSARFLLWLLPCVALAVLWILRPDSERCGRIAGGRGGLSSTYSDSPRHETVDTAPDRTAAEVRALVEGLTRGSGDGVSALLRLVAVTATRVIDRAKMSCALLEFLLEDVSRAQPRLANPRATSMALLADRFPAPRVRDMASRYMRVETNEPRLRAHAELQVLLAGWPPSEADAAMSKQRIIDVHGQVAALLGKPDTGMRIRALLEDLLRTGRYTDRALALEVITKWLREGAQFQSLIGPSVDALFQCTDKSIALLQVLVLAEQVQAESGIELAQAGAANLGMEIGLRLRDLARGEWTYQDRSQITEILARLETGPESLGGAITQATALGGTRDGDALAIAKLGELHRTSHHRTVRQTALVNMGSITNLRSLLAETKAVVDLRVLDQDAALRQSDLFAATRNVLLRHPEDIPAALEMYREALTQWSTKTPLGRELVADVIHGLADLRLEASRELLQLLSQSQDKLVAGLARKALKKLGDG